MTRWVHRDLPRALRRLRLRHALRRPRGSLLWTTGTTRNAVIRITPSGPDLRRPSGAFLLRPVVYFYTGVDRIARKWFRRPIAAQRFAALDQRILTALKERADAHGATQEAELKESVTQALLLALGEMEDIGGILAPGPREALHRRLNRLVADDLLGPDWRHVPSEDIENLRELEYREELKGLQEFLLVKAGYAETEMALVFFSMSGQ